MQSAIDETDAAGSISKPN